jgi:hypothetical protein
MGNLPSCRAVWRVSALRCAGVMERGQQLSGLPKAAESAAYSQGIRCPTCLYRRVESKNSRRTKSRKSGCFRQFSTAGHETSPHWYAPCFLGNRTQLGTNDSLPRRLKAIERNGEIHSRRSTDARRRRFEKRLLPGSEECPHWLGWVFRLAHPSLGRSCLARSHHTEQHMRRTSFRRPRQRKAE